MAFFDTIRNSFGGKSDGPGREHGLGVSLPDASTAMDDASKTIFAFKKEALEMAQLQARDRSEQSGTLSKPTMTDYFIAAQRLGEKRAEELAAKGIDWSPKVIADLSGHTMDGFEINKAELQPRPEMRRAAVMRASQMARAEGRKPTLGDALSAMQSIQQSGEKLDGSAKGIEGMKDMCDLDCDHAINDFFADIDRHADFKGTIFSNVSFHPAGTLMRGDENGVALTEGATFNNVTFNGMGTEDTVTLAKGDYANIKFTHIKGGQIEIADGTQVDGMDIRGAHASLTIGKASVSRLDAREAHIVTLEASPGAEINQALFEGSTIDMASKLDGSVWKNVQFNNANLVDVDMTGATLSNVRFANTSLENLNLAGASLTNVHFIQSDTQSINLAGATLNNVTVNGMAVRTTDDMAMVQQLQEVRGILQNATNNVAPADKSIAEAPVRSAAPLDQNAAMSEQLQAIRGTLQTATNGINAQPEAAPAPRGVEAALAQAAQTAAPRFEVANSSLNEALAGFNQGKDMVGRTQPEQTMARKLGD